MGKNYQKTTNYGYFIDNFTHNWYQFKYLKSSNKMDTNTCMYCEKTFSYAHGLRRHYLICKQKDIQEVRKQNEELLLQIETIQKHYEEKLQNQKDRYEEKLQNQKERYEKELNIAQKQLEKFENQLFEIAKQPKQQQQITNHNNQSTQTTNNRILNITNNLVPMDLTDEQIREIVKTNYTRNIFLGGPDSITEMTVSRLLTDQETGKFRIVCTDSSRNVFYYQDCDENLVKDIGMKDIHKKIQKPLVEATSSHYRKIDQENSMNDDRLSDIFIENMSFIDNELPRKLKVKLQLPVNTHD